VIGDPLPPAVAALRDRLAGGADGSAMTTA
jgi:hypothetical protein